MDCFSSVIDNLVRYHILANPGRVWTQFHTVHDDQSFLFRVHMMQTANEFEYHATLKLSYNLVAAAEGILYSRQERAYIETFSQLIPKHIRTKKD